MIRLFNYRASGPNRSLISLSRLYRAILSLHRTQATDRRGHTDVQQTKELIKGTS